MAGQQLGLFGDGQARQLAQAGIHFLHIAALQIGAANAALEHGIAHKEVVPAQQHHTALGMAGGVPDGKGQLIHGELFPLLIAAVRAFQGKELAAPAVGRLTVDPGLPLPAQHPRTAHMVIVAVGAEDGGERCVVLFENFIVLLHSGGGVNDHCMARVGDQDKAVGIKRRSAEKMKCFHILYPSDCSDVPALPGAGRYEWCAHSSVSMTMVQGPSFTRDTCISAPNSPCCTSLRPCRFISARNSS